MCQRVAERYTTTASEDKERNFLFRGLIKCENCGCYFIGEEQIYERKKNGKPTGEKSLYRWYHCSNSKDKKLGVKKCNMLGFKESELINIVLDSLEKGLSLVDEDIIQYLRENMKEECTSRLKTIETRKRAIQKEDREIENILMQMPKAFVEVRSEKLRAELEKQIERLKDRQEKLQLELRELNSEKFEDFEKRLETLEFLAGFRKLIQKPESKKNRELIHRAMIFFFDKIVAYHERDGYGQEFLEYLRDEDIPEDLKQWVEERRHFDKFIIIHWKPEFQALVSAKWRKKVERALRKVKSKKFISHQEKKASPNTLIKQSWIWRCFQNKKVKKNRSYFRFFLLTTYSFLNSFQKFFQIFWQGGKVLYPLSFIRMDEREVGSMEKKPRIFYL